MAKSILLLSSYHTESHKAWSDTLIEGLASYSWTPLKLPGRYFAWRVRGNPLSWLPSLQTLCQQNRFDVVIATSLVDLATIKGLIPELAHTPSILYFHENQFVYPKTKHQHSSIEPQMVNLYSALSATKVLFNSQFNRDSFIQGASELLRKLPDHIPQGLIECIESKSQVLPVPIQAISKPRLSQNTDSSEHYFTLLWNHRWEYDKNPEALLALVKRLAQAELPFKLILLGKRFRQQPSALIQLESEYAKHILFSGFPSRTEYLNWLHQADFAISTAIHEFQGIAMLEAVSAGCIPVAPNALSYPEWLPSCCLYEPQASAELNASVIHAKINALRHSPPPPINVQAFETHQLLPKYQKCIEALTSRISTTET